MNIQQIIAELEAMTPDGDTEIDHARADELIVNFLATLGDEGKRVAAAWTAARDRCIFWYA